MTVALPATATATAPGAWSYRLSRVLHWAGLVRVLAVKNFRQRYLRSKLGVIWALIQPLLQAAVLSFVFIIVFKVKRIPHYPLYVLSGIMSWQFFMQSCTSGTSSMVTAPRTPSSASAYERSSSVTRPRATGARRIAACSIPGRCMSAV